MLALDPNNQVAPQLAQILDTVASYILQTPVPTSKPLAQLTASAREAERLRDADMPGGRPGEALPGTATATAALSSDEPGKTATPAFALTGRRPGATDAGIDQAQTGSGPENALPASMRIHWRVAFGFMVVGLVAGGAVLALCQHRCKRSP